MSRKVFFCSVLVAAVLFGCRTTSRVGVSDASDVVSAEAAAPDRLAGRFLGFVLLGPESKASLVLDIVGSKGAGYRAVLRIQRGDFMSTEYSAFYYSEMTRDVESGQLSLRSKSEGAPVISGAVFGNRSLDGEPVIDGQMTLDASSGTSAAFQVRRMASPRESALSVYSIWPEVPALPSLSGAWTTNCGGQKLQLQMESVRWQEAPGGSAAVMPGMRIAGRFGIADREACSVSSGPCVSSVFRSGAQNIVTGEIALRGSPFDKTCVQIGERIKCDSCEFERQTAWTDRDINPPLDYALARQPVGRSSSTTAAGGVNADFTPIAPLAAGQYFGTVVHEQTGRDQVMGIRVDVAPAGESGEAGAVEVRAVASLYFGARDQNELIAYRFSPVVSTLQSGIPAGTIVDGDGEAFLVIHRWSQDAISGIVVAKSFGRVGEFEVRSSQASTADSVASAMSLPSMPALSGVYLGADWQFELSASSSVSSQPEQWFPVRVIGWARETTSTPRRRMVHGASFDPYTGALSLMLDDGRLVSGRLSHSGPDLELFWPQWPTFGTPLPSQSVSSYQRQPSTSLRPTVSSQLQVVDGPLESQPDVHDNH